MEPKHTGIMILSEDEVKKLGVLPVGRGHPVRLAMRLLKVNQYLTVPRTVWNKPNKSPRYIVTSENEKGRQYEMLQMADLSGWYIKRIA